MSFLKQHWRFIVPMAVVLCVLILGVVALYSTNEPPEPKTVYVMPERGSPDISPAFNAGVMSTSTMTTRNQSLDAPGVVPSIERETDTASATEFAELSDSDFITSDNDEVCCDEEPLAFDDRGDVTSEHHEEHHKHRERYLIWRHDFGNFHARQKAHTEAFLARGDKLDDAMVSSLAFMDPEQLQQVRVELETTMDSQEIDAFFAKIPSEPPAKTLEQLNAEIRELSQPSKVLAIEQQQLDLEWDRLLKEGEELGVF